MFHRSTGSTYSEIRTGDCRLVSLIRTAVFTLIFIVSGYICSSDAKEPLQLAEQEIKAGFLYNFLKYTKWPGEKSPKLSVCVYGDDPFNGSLRAMAERTVNQQKIKERVVSHLNDVSSCHLLFINKKEKNQWPRIREALSGKPVLTVSDFPGFSASGGMIEFGHEGKHISIMLNIGAATSSGLIIEERLLKLITVTGVSDGD